MLPRRLLLSGVRRGLASPSSSGWLKSGSGSAKSGSGWGSVKSAAAVEEEPFAKQLRESKFVQLGDLEGADGRGTPVLGEIVLVMEEDLYIDFGGKFNCVCRRPRKDRDKYKLGAFVYLLLRDTELSSRFLGAGKDITLLEADATLVGLYQPKKKDQPPEQSHDKEPRKEDPNTPSA